MSEKKNHKPFSESDLTGKGFIEVSKNVFVKATAPELHPEKKQSPVQKLTAQIKNQYNDHTIVTAGDNGHIRNGKYGVASVTDRSTGGKTYDSKLEMKYRQHLELLFKAGEVINIEEQVPYELMVSGKKICVYVLDFRVTYKDGSKKWIDCKGVATAVYRIKKKLFEAIFHPIVITEIKHGDF